jgi:hypothetical protein
MSCASEPNKPEMSHGRENAEMRTRSRRDGGLHNPCPAVYAEPMAKTSRLNVVLDEEHAVKLRRLADRTHTNPGTIARSLLSAALEEADPDPRNVTELLDRIPGALDRAERGAGEARLGQATPLEDL